MKAEEWPRLAITALILGCFAMALLLRYSTGLEETLKNVVMLSVGYWLGSSKGAADSNARADKALDLAAANAVGNTDASKAAADVAGAAADKADEIKGENR